MTIVVKQPKKNAYCAELEGLDDINSPEDDEWAAAVREMYGLDNLDNTKPPIVVKPPKE